MEVTGIFHNEFTRYLSSSSGNATAVSTASFNFSDWFSGGKINFGEVYNDTNDFTKNLKPVGDIDFHGVLASTALNFFLFIVLALGYEVLRRKLPNIFLNKYQREEERQRKLENETGTTNLVPLSWLGPVFGVPWSKILEDGGLDAYMYLRYVRMCLRATSVSAFWAMVVLWPIYGTGGGDMRGFYLLSMANIKTDDNWRFWFSTAFMYIFTMYFFYVLDQELAHFISLRLDFLGKGLPGIHPQHHYSLMVEGIPKELRSDKALYQYFDRLFPDKVHSARVVVTVPELDYLSSKKLKITRKLEKSIANFIASGERPIHVVGRKRFMCCNVECISFDIHCRKAPVVDLEDFDDDCKIPKGTNVESVSYYTRQLKIINSSFFKMQQEKNKGAETGNVAILAENWFTYIAQATGNLDQYLNPTTETQSLYGSFKNDSLTVALQSRTFDSNESKEVATNNSFESKKGNELRLKDFYKQTNRKKKTIVEPGSSEIPLEDRTFISTIPLRLGFDFITSGYESVKKKVKNTATKHSLTSNMSGTGFVTFLDLASVTCAANAPLSHKSSALRTQVAPERRDVFWKNAHVSFKTQNRRENVANVCIALGAIFWSIPIAAIQAFASIDQLAQIPGMEWLGEVFHPQDKVLVNSYLPVVALLCILMLLPIIFEKVAVKYEKRKSLSDIQRSVVIRYFYYQLANVYIVVTAGSIWNSLATILDHPRSIVEIFGNSLPFVVGYFVSVLITKALAGLPMVILRIGSVFRFIFLRLLFKYDNLTQRELDGVYRRERFYYGYEYPNQLFVIVICFTYVCIAPIILVVGAIYFLVALIVYKKQILFVCTAEFESGGSIFPMACKNTVIGLILGQITFIGYLSVRKAYMQSLLSWPLLLLTFWWMGKLQELYIDNSSALTLERAVDLDKATVRRQTNGFETVGIQDLFRDDHYRQPILTERPGIPLPYRRGQNDLLTEEAIRKLRSSAMPDHDEPPKYTSPEVETSTEMKQTVETKGIFS